MNKKQKAELLKFPSLLDTAVKKKFRVECNSNLDLLGGGKWDTVFEAKGSLKKEIEAFIEGWISGNLELRERLLDLTK